jgi:hypothetical protein
MLYRVLKALLGENRTDDNMQATSKGEEGHKRTTPAQKKLMTK